jgi:hypothetical protein
MKKVLIKSITSPSGCWDGEATEILVDGERVAFGNYGGEPEDNLRCRDYDWVEDAFVKLAKALGAEVELVEDNEVNDNLPL